MSISNNTTASQLENDLHPISYSSDDEEDGDEQWKAAIHAAAAASFLGISQPNKPPTPPDDDYSGLNHLQAQPIKHYQIKAQKTLDELLEKSLLMVKDLGPVDPIDDQSVSDEGGVRLFKQAPVGIVFDSKDQYKGPTKRPRILPGVEINEKSKKFKRRLQSVVVEGSDIIAAARDALQKSLSRLEAKEAAAREAAKREEERVAQLKKIRGEKWLPSIAREMQVRSQVH